MSRPTAGDPGPDVLADLLLAAVEADCVEDAYALLADLVGEGPVRSAHGIALDRLADAVAAAAGAGAVDGYTGDGAAAERPGSREGPSEAAMGLVRRLPDPLTGGRAGREAGAP